MTAEQELNEKWSVHNAVKSAIESAHNNPAPQTIKMFDEMRQDNKESFNRIEKKLDINTEMTVSLDKRVDIANGRTRKLEDFSVEMKNTMEVLAKNIEQNKDEYQGDKSWAKGAIWVIVGLMVVVPTICTFTFGLYLKNRDYEIDKKIRSTIVDVLDEKATEVKYEK